MRVIERGRPRATIMLGAVAGLIATACGSSTSDTTSSAGGSAAARSTSFSGTFKMGVLVVLSGPNGSIGNIQKSGLAMAAQEINDKGGILGKQVVLDEADSGGNPTASVQGARKLIQQDQVDALFGPTLSVETVPVLPLATTAKIVEFGTSVTPKTDTTAHPYYFRMSPAASLQASTFVAEMRQKGWTKAGLLAVNSPLGSSNIAAFKAAIAGTDISIVDTEIDESGTVDVSPQMQKIKSANADVVLVFETAEPDMIAAVKARNTLLWTVPMLGFSAIAFPNVTKSVGADGMTNVLAGQEYLQLTRGGAPKATTDWLGRLRARLGVSTLTTDSSQAAIGYDALMMYADAANKSGSTDAVKVRAYLEQHQYSGVATTYHYSADAHEGITVDGLTFVPAASFKDGQFAAS